MSTSLDALIDAIVQAGWLSPDDVQRLERVLRDVVAERQRQVGDGWTPEHDDDHDTHALVRLAEQYAHKPESERFEHNGYYSRRRLVQATALLVAAIEAWDRREATR